MNEKIPNRKQYRKANKPTEELRQEIEKLDLTPVRQSIQSEERWHDHVCDYFERQYRNFLFLCGSTGEIIVPTQALDVFWHYHILDTLKYEEDCARIFGFYLHHFPYLGKQGDAEELVRHFERTKQLYEATFGEAYEINEATGLDPDIRARFASGGDNCG